MLLAGPVVPVTMRAAREALRAAAHTVSRGAATSAGAPGVAGGVPVRIHNPSGVHRVVVTKDLPGTRWLDILTAANCRVEVRAPRCTDSPFVEDTPSRGSVFPKRRAVLTTSRPPSQRGVLAALPLGMHLPGDYPEHGHHQAAAGVHLPRRDRAAD